MRNLVRSNGSGLVTATARIIPSTEIRRGVTVQNADYEVIETGKSGFHPLVAILITLAFGGIPLGAIGVFVKTHFEMAGNGAHGMTDDSLGIVIAFLAFVLFFCPQIARVWRRTKSW